MTQAWMLTLVVIYQLFKVPGAQLIRLTEELRV